MKDEELMSKFVEVFGDDYSNGVTICTWKISPNRDFDYQRLTDFYGLWNYDIQDYIFRVTITGRLTVSIL